MPTMSGIQSLGTISSFNEFIPLDPIVVWPEEMSAAALKLVPVVLKSAVVVLKLVVVLKRVDGVCKPFDDLVGVDVDEVAVDDLVGIDVDEDAVDDLVGIDVDEDAVDDLVGIDVDEDAVDDLVGIDVDEDAVDDFVGIDVDEDAVDDLVGVDVDEDAVVERARVVLAFSVEFSNRFVRLDVTLTVDVGRVALFAILFVVGENVDLFKMASAVDFVFASGYFVGDVWSFDFGEVIETFSFFVVSVFE